MSHECLKWHWPEFVVGCIVALFATAIIVSCLWEAEVRDLRAGAVERGVAEWAPSPSTGKLVFTWKEPPK